MTLAVLRFDASLIFATLSTRLNGVTTGRATGAGAAAGAGPAGVLEPVLAGVTGTSEPSSFFSASPPCVVSAPTAARAPRSWSSRLELSAPEPAASI